MCNIRITRFLAGLFLALAFATQSYAQSSATRPPDGCETATARAQAGSLIDRDLVAREEQRAETLLSKLFEVQMREIELQTRIEDLDYRLTPEGIQRALLFVSSVRPVDELRDALRIRLEGEKARVTKLLELLVSTRERLEAAIREGDAELERVRQGLNSPR